MALTRVSPALFQVSNNITSVTVGGSANTISLTFDSNGVITGASNNAVSVANTAITGNIVSSQIASVNGSVITANTIANSAIQTGAVENYMNAAGLGFGMRNRIINGAMVVNQRGYTTASPLNVGAGGFTYITDRFSAYVSVTSKMTFGQSTVAPSGFINSLNATTTTAYSITAGDLFMLTQPIEGLNVADLGWGAAGAATVTLSFWVRSSLTGTFGGSILNSGTTRSYPFTYTISVANTWEQKTITIAGDTSGTWLTTNGIGMHVSFGIGMGSTYSGTAGSWSGNQYWSATGATSVVGTGSATFYITGVQLEKGSTATSFDYRPYGQELLLCQRYYEAVNTAGGYWYSVRNDGTYRLILEWLVKKRSAPTATLAGNVGSGSFTTLATVLSTTVDNADCGAGASCSFSTYTCSAEL